MKIKICGISTVEAAGAAIEAGADALGFVFAESPRCVSVVRACSLAADLPPQLTRVAVFHHPQPREVARVVSEFRPDVVQTEPDPAVISAIGRRARLLPVFHDDQGVVERILRYDSTHGGYRYVLLEAAGRGGRGRTPHWGRAAAVARAVELVLAGGLGPDNVAEAIARVRPAGVDVSSGVESAVGVKDVTLIARFVSAARRAELAVREPVAAQGRGS